MAKAKLVKVKKEAKKTVKASTSAKATADKPSKKVVETKPKATDAKAMAAKKVEVTPKIVTTDANGIADVEKQAIITDFALKSGDTGSPEVQIALATHKILNLAKHLELNPKDNHSRRGLLKIISKRRRILNYLSGIDEGRYKELIKRLGLKK